MEFASYPSLRGRPVFITGGATGIGADIVRAFHGQGARVGFVDIQDEPAAALNASCGGDLWYSHCDVTDAPSLQKAIGDCSNDIGAITVLVNNAANDTRIKINDITPEIWDQSFDVNLRPHFFAAQAVRPGMASAGGGAILNLSSITWRHGPAELAAYASAKAGVVALTKSLGRAFGDDNIRVNAIEPGAVMTDRQRELWFKSQAQVDAIVERQSLKRVLLGEEIARMALFLASDDAGMITKQSFIVDAGIQ